jgi:hypothetical protein
MLSRHWRLGLRLAYVFPPRFIPAAKRHIRPERYVPFIFERFE